MDRLLVTDGKRRVRTFSEASIRANNRKKTLQGPLRVLRLCVLSIIFPGILVGLPLYMRFFVYGEQAYPVGMSDMRLLDHRISTTWCQSQTVRSNGTFDAYLMASTPEMEKEHEYVSMTRDLNNLADDMKEYWGFYLLKGSVITVSACARFPGASLIMIRGHKHLRDCAYIGDDSSEELDELYPDDVNSTETQTANKPARMTRMSDGVVVHGKSNSESDVFEFHHRREQVSMSDSVSRDAPKKISRTGLKLGNKIHLDYAEFGNKLAKQFIQMEKLKSNHSDSSNKNKKLMNRNHLNTESSTTQSSKEIYDDVIKKLESLGDKGKRVLERLNKQKPLEEIKFNSTVNSTNLKSDLAKTKVNSTEITMNAKHKIRHNKRFNSSEEVKSEMKRGRREILNQEYRSFHEDLTKHDEEADAALEEGMQDVHVDGFAQIRNTINETSPFDKSNSELWSSFSSSEERLLNCEGLLVNLPLKSHEMCNENLTGHHHGDLLNSITYRVTMNGYYFFVFNSENEIKPNFLRIHFRLEKTKYDVSKPVASCKNQTAFCNLPLTFWSQQKVVLQVPVRSNDAPWNEEFLVVSTCEPRTAIYMLCVIAVPLFIMLFAFQ